MNHIYLILELFTPCHRAQVRFVLWQETSDDNPPLSHYKGFDGQQRPQTVSRYPHSRTCMYK